MDMRAMVMDVRMVVMWGWVVLVDGVMMLNRRIFVLDGGVVYIVVLRLMDDIVSDVVFLG